MRITKTEDGKWQVGDQVFDTNAEAWRYLDRRSGEPVSKAEDRSQWVVDNILNSPRLT